MSTEKTTLKCECCSWSGPEADLEADFACPQCGERVWADQTVPQQTTKIATVELERLRRIEQCAMYLVNSNAWVGDTDGIEANLTELTELLNGGWLETHWRSP